ncbi:MAG: hypothetical protein ACE5I5_07330 [Candidatus Heimdallarchaeota archaeon]
MAAIREYHHGARQTEAAVSANGVFDPPWEPGTIPVVVGGARIWS